MAEVDDRAEDLILALTDEGFFRIDPDGSIWKCKIKNGRDVKPVLPAPYRAEYDGGSPYLRLRVSVHGIRIRVSAHRIVYRYFKGDIPPGYEIDHINRNTRDNRPDNLEAVTHAENIRRMYQ